MGTIKTIWTVDNGCEEKIEKRDSGGKQQNWLKIREKEESTIPKCVPGRTAGPFSVKQRMKRLLCWEKDEVFLGHPDSRVPVF